MSIYFKWSSAEYFKGFFIIGIRFFVNLAFKQELVLRTRGRGAQYKKNNFWIVVLTTTMTHYSKPLSINVHCAISQKIHVYTNNILRILLAHSEELYSWFQTQAYIGYNTVFLFRDVNINIKEMKILYTLYIYNVNRICNYVHYILSLGKQDLIFL